jgi:hypothetical protein
MRATPSSHVRVPLARRLAQAVAGSRGDAGSGSGPRILVLTAPALVRSVPDVFVNLLDAGAEVVFSGKDVESQKIPEELLAHPRVSTLELPLWRADGSRRSVDVLRTAADLTRFLNPSLEGSNWPRMYIARRLLKMLGHPEYDGLSIRMQNMRLPGDVYARVSSTMRDLERLLPPPAGLAEAVELLQPDVVLLLTRCEVGGFEPDAIKVARKLGVPSILMVRGWDNLTGKAVLNEHPDRIIVWNEAQVREAVELHGIPRERVVTAGASNFDRFFEALPANGGAPSHRSANRRPTVLYLGSCKVARNEPALFTQWLEAVRSAADPALREAQVVVRPHPGERKPWRIWEPPDDPLLSVQTTEKIKSLRLATLLREADVVVALSSTAEIEAAIIGCPVVTFRAGAQAPAQEGQQHFYYLLEEHGGFVIDSRDLEEHVANLARVLHGDYGQEPMRRFVESFVRPAGVAQPVAPLVASAVLETARRATPKKRSGSGALV